MYMYMYSTCILMYCIPCVLHIMSCTVSIITSIIQPLTVHLALWHVWGGLWVCIICPSACLSVCLFVSVCLSVYLSRYVCLFVSVCLSVRVCLSLSVCGSGGVLHSVLQSNETASSGQNTIIFPVGSFSGDGEGGMGRGLWGSGERGS